MKLFWSPLRILITFLLFSGLVHAADPGIGQGLRVALNTKGFKFKPPLPAAIETGGPSASFLATVAVTNGSRSPIRFTFPARGDASQLFTFRVLDGDGEELWRSEPDATPPTPQPGVITITGFTRELRPGATFRRSIQVPLSVAGAALPDGRYSLEATLNAHDFVSASTLFEVVSQPSAPTSNVSGWVLTTNHHAENDTFVAEHAPAQGASVYPVKGHNPPFTPADYVLGNSSDASGRFQIGVAPGRYTFRAHQPISYGPPPIIIVFDLTSTNVPQIPPNPYHGLPPFTLPAFRAGHARAIVTQGKICQPVIMLGSGREEKRLITGVTEVLASKDPSDATKVVLEAAGITATAGWSQPMLVSEELTEDGFLLMDFMARAPSEGSAQVITGIQAFSRLPLLPGMKGVKVRGQLGTFTALLPE